MLDTLSNVKSRLGITTSDYDANVYAITRTIPSGTTLNFTIGSGGGGGGNSNSPNTTGSAGNSSGVGGNGGNGGQLIPCRWRWWWKL